MSASDWEPGGGFLPPSSQPRRVRGGIRLQSRRGGTEWWSRRFLAAIEAAAIGERLAQGIDDARRGQVLELEVDLGVVRARVQGTRREPHEASLRLAVIDQAAWLPIVRHLAARGSSRRELLAGAMPDDVEAAFRRHGVGLFPALEDDVEFGCTCEDWSAPCRHLLAACMLVSEHLDRDPLLAFRLRGIEPAMLRAIVGGVGAATGAVAEDERPEQPPASTVDAGAFWHGSPATVASLAVPAVDAPLVRVLGAPPLWRGADSFEPAMRRLYARVASDPRTVDLALGSAED